MATLGVFCGIAAELYGVCWRSTIYEGSDDSKSKTGSSADSRGSTRSSSSSATSSVHGTTCASTTVAASTRSWSHTASGTMPTCRALTSDDVAATVCDTLADHFTVLTVTVILPCCVCL